MTEITLRARKPISYRESDLKNLKNGLSSPASSKTTIKKLPISPKTDQTIHDKVGAEVFYDTLEETANPKVSYEDLLEMLNQERKSRQIMEMQFLEQLKNLNETIMMLKEQLARNNQQATSATLKPTLAMIVQKEPQKVIVKEAVITGPKQTAPEKLQTNPEPKGTVKTETKAPITIENEWTTQKNRNKEKRNAKLASLIRKQPKQEDLKVHKIYARISLAPSLRKAAVKQRISTMRKVFDAWGLRGKIAEFSLIGKSIAEIYVYEINLNEVKEKINNQGIELCGEFNVKSNLVGNRALPDCEDSIVNRIAFLIVRNQGRKSICQAALLGHSTKVQELAHKKAQEVIEERQSMANGGNSLNA